MDSANFTDFWPPIKAVSLADICDSITFRLDAPNTALPASNLADIERLVLINFLTHRRFSKNYFFFWSQRIYAFRNVDSTAELLTASIKRK